VEGSAVEEALLRRAVAGDRGAAEAVLAQLLPRVRNLIRYLVRGDQDVDDMAQQALVAILRGLPSYRGDAPLSKWADRITAREALAYARRRRARAAREAGDAPLEVLPAPEETERYLARRELALRLDALPDPQREAIVLHHLLAMSVPEVAASLEISPDTAKSRIRLGMEKLRAAAKEDAP
jgi:RNA polymerase sigma-70 factor (ECF subfamily)